MIVHDVEQGTPAWYQLRAGIPTASQFHRILTPGGKPSKSAEEYMFELIGERIMGHSKDLEDDGYQSVWMARGKALEKEARMYYKIRTGLDIRMVGFITNDAGTVGASPDALVVGGKGGLEIKSPGIGQQTAYLFHRPLDDKHRPQVQGQIWIAELDWLDTLAYHPELPRALIRAERDAEYIGKLEAVMTAFTGELETRWEEWRTRNAVEVPG